MNERGRNEADISRYTDVEYSPEGYKTVYRWGDFLEIAGGHVYNAMDTIDLVSAGGEYEGFNPRYAYTCEFVGCSTLIDGIALFRPVSRDGEDLTQIAFLRSDIDDDTGAYTERFEAGSFDIAAASDIQCSDLGIDLLDYFRGRSFEGLSGVKRGLNGREAVGAVEVATGCDLDLFEDFWLGSPGETDVHVGPYVKRDLIALSYIVNDFSQMYGTTARDIRKLLARVNNFHPDRLAAVKAYLDCEYVTDRDTSDEKTYRWSDFLEIAGGDARYAAMLIERTAPGEPQEGLHPETLVDQDIRDGEAFMLAGRPIAPEDIYDLPGTVHGLYSELVDNVGRSGTLARDWRGFSAGTDADDVLREIDGAFGETEYSRAGTVLGAYCDPIGVGWNYGPIYYFPHESVEQIVGQLCEDGDDFPILFDGENVIEAFDGSPVHMSAPVEVDGERVWTCGYDFCWGETVAPDFSRARGHFPDATVAAWAAARSVNESDGYLGIKERL